MLYLLLLTKPVSLCLLNMSIPSTPLNQSVTAITSNGSLVAPTNFLTNTDNLNTISNGVGFVNGTLPVSKGGTNAVSLTGYVKGNGTATFTASATVPSSDITGLGTMSTQNASNVAITGGNITGITDLAVSDGGTGSSTLTGYVKGNGTSALTASGTIPNTDITGLGTMSTQNANTVAITGGNITGITDLLVADGGTGASTLTGYVKGSGTAALTASATIPNTDITGLGTMSTQNSSSISVTGGTMNNVALGTPLSGTLTNCVSLPISTGVSGLGTNVATFLVTPNSTNLRFAVTDETGTGSLVFNNAATFIAPILGTPASVVLTNGTGLPLTTGVTGTLPIANGGTGVTTSTGTTNVVLSGSPTIVTPVIAQINDASANAALKLASIASAVNQVTIENAATGNAVHVTATGTDASIGLHLAGKGASGYVNVQDSVDATKRIMFNAAGGTTNTRTMLSSTQTVDRTISLPDATDTLVGKATTDTLTNKTLTSPTLTAPVLGTPTSGNLANCTFPTLNQSTTGSAATLTTPRAIYGNNFDGSAALTQVIASTYGGTGNGFAKFSGPASSEKTFTLPNASSTLLYDGGALGTPASGTVTNLTGTASININGTVGATTPSTVAATTISASGTTTITTADNTYGLKVSGATNKLRFSGYTTTGSFIDAVNAAENALTQLNFQGSTININPAGSTVGAFSSTGLAVTGRIIATTTLDAGSNSINGVLTLNGPTSAGNGSITTFQRGSVAIGHVGSFDYLGGGTSGDMIVNAISGHSTHLTVNSTDVAVVSSTGLAVTGALSASGQATLSTTLLVGSGATLTGSGVEVQAANFQIIGRSSSTTRMMLAHDGTKGKIGTLDNQSFDFLVNNAIVGTFSSTGLAVTGALTATGIVGAGDYFNATAADNHYRINGNTIIGGSGTALYIKASSSINTQVPNGSTITTVSSTGLAVTGTLSTTGAVTIGGSGTVDGNIYNKSDGTTYGQFIGSGYIMAANVGASVALLNRNGSDGGIINFYRSGTTVGTITVTSTTTAYNTSSDYRLKNITGSLTNSGTFIDALKPKVGTWKSNGSEFVGFLAHEFAEISPSSVSGEKDAVDADGKPIYQSMQASSSEVIANLVAELQSLRARLAVLEAK